jgi:hypothetical protein
MFGGDMLAPDAPYWRERGDTMSPQPGIEPGTKPVPARDKPARTRTRDEFFEATAEICGYDLSSIGPEARRKIGKAAKEAHEGGGTPALIRGFAVVWEEAHPDIPVTPQIIWNHWADYMVERIVPLARRRR